MNWLAITILGLPLDRCNVAIRDERIGKVGICMREQLKKYEQEYAKSFEEKVARREYEEAYMKSKNDLEERIQRQLRLEEARERKNYWQRAGKIAAACVAAVLVTAISVPDIRTVAADFLHSTMGLQVAGVRDDGNGKVSDKGKTDGKGDGDQKERGFSFAWLMQFTEKEYWEWAQRHELAGKEVPTYVPEGFREVRDDPNAYGYLYVENKDMPWSDKKMDPKDNATYGRFGKMQFPAILSQAERKKQVDDPSVLCAVNRRWKKGQRELWYQKELYDIFELEGHEEKKDNEAKKLMVGGDDAYLFYEDGAWLYVFGETTLTKLFVDCDAEHGKALEEAEEILVKVAESVQK